MSKEPATPAVARAGAVVRRAAPDEWAAVALVLRSSMRDPWTEDMVRQALSQRECLAMVAACRPPSGQLVGASLARVTGREAEVLLLAVVPGWRRRHLGTLLLEATMAECVALGAREVFLEVRRSNEAALGLYVGRGFRQVGRRVAYYSNGETALVLSRSLVLPPPPLPAGAEG